VAHNTDNSYTAVTVNGGNLTIPDINFTDSDGITTTVPSVQDLVCTPAIQVPDSLYNPTKTGRTSFIPGDDGETQIGRLLDYYTLDFTNPYGNSTRFTNDLGGLYNDNSDGSTPDYIVDNATKLGYRISLFSGNVQQAINNALTLTVGVYSGFSVMNINQFIPIADPNGGFKPNVGVFGDFNQWNFNTFYSSTLVLATLSNGLPYVAGLTRVGNQLNVRNHIY